MDSANQDAAQYLHFRETAQSMNSAKFDSLKRGAGGRTKNGGACPDASEAASPRIDASGEVSGCFWAQKIGERSRTPLGARFQYDKRMPLGRVLRIRPALANLWLLSEIAQLIRRSSGLVERKWDIREAGDP